MAPGAMVKSDNTTAPAKPASPQTAPTKTAEPRTADRRESPAPAPKFNFGTGAGQK